MTPSTGPSPEHRQRLTADARFRYAGRDFTLRGFHRDDHIFRVVESTRTFYEIELLEYLRFIATLTGRRGGVAIDVGANIGNHSIFFGTFLADRVIAVEPNPPVVEVLRHNLAINRVPHALFDCAVGATAGEGAIVVDVATNNVGMARLERGSGVKVETLDAIVDAAGARGRVWLVKIDVEGGEIAALEGARGLLRRERPHVVAEVATQAQDRAIRALLEEEGYAPVCHLGRSATPVCHFAYRPAPWLRWAARLQIAATLPRQTMRRITRKVRLLRGGSAAASGARR